MKKNKSRDRSANKKGATHKVNPASTKIARKAFQRTITLGR